MSTSTFTAEQLVRFSVLLMHTHSQLPDDLRSGYANIIFLIKTLISDPSCLMSPLLSLPFSCDILNFDDDQRKAICKELECCKFLDPCCNPYGALVPPSVVMQPSLAQRSLQGLQNEIAYNNVPGGYNARSNNNLADPLFRSLLPKRQTPGKKSKRKSKRNNA